MLELVEVSSFLTKQLNTYAKNVTPSYEFDIRAEVGKYENNSTVYGLLRSTKPILPPVAGVKNIKYSLGVKLQVVSPLVNFNLKNIENIIGEFVENWNGKEVEFSKGKGLLNLTLTATEGFRTESGQGNIVPIEFDVGINYTENVVTSGTKHWLLDGVEIPFLSEGIIVERNGKTSPINDRSYEQTFLTNQRKLYRFTFNYDTSNELCASLQRDLLDGELNKTYVLEYYDGYSYTEDNKYKTIVSILRNGNAYSQKPDTSMFDITFADVDDGMNQTKYYMALIDNPFDSQTENTRYFESQQEQIEYYAEKIENGADFDEIQAPNLNSLYITNQIYKNTNQYDVFDLVNKNYAIIKVVKGSNISTFAGKDEDDEEENQPVESNDIYFYYRVNSADIGLENQVSYDLQLDSLQTFYFNNKLNIQGSFIQKAHLDRWVETEEGDYQFNGKIDSSLFEREEIKNVAKRLVERKKLKYSTEQPYCLYENKEMVEWINKAVDFWIYLIVDVGDYTLVSGKVQNLSETKVVENSKLQADTLGYSVAEICIPFMQDGDVDEYGIVKNYTIKTSGELDSIWDYEGMLPLLLLNGGYSKVKSIKISLKPPFMFNKDTFAYNIDNYDYDISNPTALPYSNLILHAGIIDRLGDDDNETNEYLLGGETSDGQVYSNLNNRLIQTLFYAGKLPPSTPSCSALIYQYDFKEPIYLESDITLPRTRFYRHEILGSSKSKELNPKLNDEDYKNLTLSFMGNTFNIPINKLNQERVIIKYTEMITPDATKGIARVVIENEDGIFNKDYENSFNGFIFTNDFSLPISNGQLESYLANNKNAFLSFQAQQDYNRDVQTISNAQSLVNGATSAISNVAMGNWGGAISGAVNTGINIAFNESKFRLGQSLRETQFDLSIDNMRNAPRTLVNANGNAIFGDAVSEFGMYIELYEGLDHELEVVNDMMHRDGYTYNRFGEVKDFDNIRANFNYVRAILGNISGVPMSENARRDLRDRFASGIRFWKSDNIDYSVGNYESRIY